MARFSINSGAQTVIHLGTIFEELKARAATLIETQIAEDRGYFTPSEEETLRGLQISYWQARAALLELAHDYHDQQKTMSEAERPLAFVVAYAAVLLLVDAARFMRDQVHDRETIRVKLNESAEEFGIPRDAYEIVQRSLTSPWHAWHLYHALEYFRQHEAELRQTTEAAGLSELWSIINRLNHRLDVVASDLVGARLRARTKQAARAMRHDLLGRALFGLHKLVGTMMANKYMRPGHKPGVPNAIREVLCETMQSGDVLVVRKEYALTNYFLPGFWPHAALYLGETNDLAQLGLREDENVGPRWQQFEASEGDHVLEAMADGVLIRSIESPLASDSVVVLRPRLTQEQIAEALSRGLSHEGKRYDFDFDFARSDRLVCTEVVYRAYQGIGGIEFPMIRRAGRETLGGRELIRMGIDRNFFETVAVYSPTHADAVLHDHQAHELVAKIDEEND